MLENIKLIIFDLDGTLADTIGDLANAAQHTCSEYGNYTVTEELAKNSIGNGLKLFLDRIYNHFGIKTDSFEDDFVSFKKYYFDNVCVKTRLYDDTEHTLKEIRDNGITMVVATMKPFKPAKEILEHFNIAGYFSDMLAGDTMPEPKPSAKIIDYFANKYSVSRDEILVVGDGMTDVNLALNSKTHCAALTDGYGNHSEIINSNADYKIKNLSEILNIIGD